VLLLLVLLLLLLELELILPVIEAQKTRIVILEYSNDIAEAEELLRASEVDEEPEPLPLVELLLLELELELDLELDDRCSLKITPATAFPPSHLQSIEPGLLWPDQEPGGPPPNAVCSKQARIANVAFMVRIVGYRWSYSNDKW
jgi:hypothetical protein